MITRNEFRELLRLQYVYMDPTIEALYNALSSGRHIILFGEPGHGKSEIAIDASDCFYKASERFILSIDRRTPAEALTGPLDIPKLMTAGESSIVVKQSIMSHKVAILEEGFDSRVASVLKDLLTRKAFCTGDICYPLLTKTIILCTNVTPDVWAKDASDRALVERFFYQVNVNWPAYTPSNYMEMFKRKFSASDASKLGVIANLAAQQTALGQIFSPRSAIWTAQQYLQLGVEGLHGAAGLGPNIVRDLEKMEQRVKTDEEMRRLAKLVYEMESPADAKAAAHQIKLLRQVKEQCSKLRPDNEGLEHMKRLLEEIKGKHERATTTYVNLTVGTPS